jgi:phosphohistidine phosphatase
MKIVGLLRHAKASRDEPRLADIDRPLAPRGERDAERMGEELRRRGASFDLVLASPARRVIDTIENFERGYGPLKPTYEPALYENTVGILLNILGGLGDAAERVLLIGHNPSLQGLATKLASREDDSYAIVAEKFPTAAAVLIELPATHWADVEPGTGRILWFVTPKAIDD